MQAKAWQGKSVVVVDDAPTVRSQLTAVYETLGFSIMAVATNGVEALAAVEKSQPDLVSLDLIMPEMDGVECYRKLKRLYPQLPVVVVSWLGGEAKVLERLAEIVPSSLFIAKPVTAESLALKLQEVLGAQAPSLPTAGDRQGDAAAPTRPTLVGLSAKVG